MAQLISFLRMSSLAGCNQMPNAMNGNNRMGDSKRYVANKYRASATTAAASGCCGI